MGFLDRIIPRRPHAESKICINLPDDRILRYKITGRNPGTGRRNTKRVICGSWEPLSDVESRTGLHPPFTHELDMPEVTESQLALMEREGVPLIDGMYRADASALIQHALDGVQLFPDQGLPRPILQFLVNHNVLISSWMTFSDFEDEFLDGMPGLRQIIKNCK